MYTIRSNMKISELCLPVKIYFIVMLIGVIVAFTNPNSAKNIIAGLLIDAVYVCVMIWACNAGYVTAAWILLLLPFIVIVFFVLILGLFVMGTIQP